jgi:Prokaryotic E2 family E
MAAADPSGKATEEDGLDLLPAADVEAVRARGLKASAHISGQEIHLIIRDYPLPAGFDHEKTVLLLRLPRQWPDGAPDMFWTDPHVKIAASGAWPIASAHLMVIDSRTWQRWSRHYRDRWRAGVDRLENLLLIVNREIGRDVGK